LAVNTLVKSVDDLFKGSSSTGGIFSKIFDIFTTSTGVDLVGTAQSGAISTGSSWLPPTTSTSTTAVSEIWETSSSTTQLYEVEGILVERFTSITFERPNGYKVQLNIDWPT
jgi:hypothetical protein